MHKNNWSTDTDDIPEEYIINNVLLIGIIYNPKYFGSTIRYVLFTVQYDKELNYIFHDNTTHDVINEIHAWKVFEQASDSIISEIKQKHIDEIIKLELG